MLVNRVTHANIIKMVPIVVFPPGAMVCGKTKVNKQQHRDPKVVRYSHGRVIGFLSNHTPWTGALGSTALGSASLTMINHTIGLWLEYVGAC